MPENKIAHAYEPKSAWSAVGGEAGQAELDAFCGAYLDFLSDCKTEREIVARAEELLREKGFGDDPKGAAFVKNLRGKALFAFRRGSLPLSRGVRLVAAHGDCPRLDFKPHPIVEQQGFVQAKTHYYGGLRKYQWLSRPLALHGVVALADGGVVSLALGERPGDPVFTIADLLPHLAQKQMAQSVKEAVEGEELNVLLASRPQAGEAD